jgi:glycosyltransferase involved in cell wall biosynthesis
MHVLVTADTVGGVWTYTRELVTGLAQRGNRVTLVSFGEIPAAAQTEWLTPLNTVDFYPTAFRLEWMQEVEDDLKASSDYLLRIIDDNKPDLLHFSQFAYGALPVDVPKVVVAHSDVLSWWVAVHGRESESNPWIGSYRQIVARGLAGAEVVVVPSRWMLQALGEHYGRTETRRLIYNGRNPGLFNAHTAKEDLILGVGRMWDAGKQLRLLSMIQAPWPVVVAGSDEHPDRAYAERKIAVNGQLSFRGALNESELRHLYTRASIFVGTSRYEPFGLAPLEAALSRCALVLNDIPTFREIWGESAYYFQTNDAGDLERVMARLCEDRQLRLTYANLAYRRALSMYTAHRMVDQYVQLYDALVPERMAAA